MNKLLLQRIAGPVALMLLVLMTAGGCGKEGGKQAAANVDYYTCTMHPSVKMKDPGKCPICAMDLVPVAKREGQAKASGADQAGDKKGAGMADMKGMAMPGAGAGGESSEFVVPIERQQQIGVTYAAVERKPLNHTIRSVGLIVPDRTRRWEFVPRVEGYVQKLYVTSPGELVEKDQPLLTIYSPDLFAGKREFIQLLEARDKNPAMRASSERLIQSARRRLELWNITPEQIAELEKTRQPSDTMTLLSPFRGIVEKVAADQGKRVMVGESLVSVADLSLVWLWAEFYENELSMLRQGQTLDITVNPYPGEKFTGTISLINPFVEEMKRTAKVRVDIPNADFRLRPGMYANAELTMEMGEGLTIPVSAIMPTGRRTYVFVDRKEGKLEPRLVQIGQKYGEFYSVQSGLSEGERVVSSANFLIDAESKVQGALAGFEEPATGAPSERPAPIKPGEQAATVIPTPPPGAENAMPEPAPLGSEARPLFEQLFDVYLPVQKQLARNKFDGVPEKAAQLREQVEAIGRADLQPSMHTDAYRAWIDSLRQKVAKFQPKNIDEARVQFGELSWDLVAVVTQFPPPLGRRLRSMHCPMWKNSPACWIQVGDETENPFLGPPMLTCGNEVKSLAEVK